MPIQGNSCAKKILSQFERARCAFLSYPKEPTALLLLRRQPALTSRHQNFFFGKDQAFDACETFFELQQESASENERGRNFLAGKIDSVFSRHRRFPYTRETNSLPRRVFSRILPISYRKTPTRLSSPRCPLKD